jgi:hypothetical protein
MARYPAPLNETEWNYFQGHLNKPLTEDHKRRIIEMVNNGKKIKIHT